MTQKDFKVKNGIILSGNITSTNSGFVFDSTANTLSIGGTTVALATDINTVQSNVATNTTRINTVQSNVAILTTSINTIKANVDSVASNVATLTSSVNTIKANVDSVSSNVATTQTNVNTVQSNLNTLTSSVNSIKANVDSVSANVATNTTRINTVQSNVATLTTSINTIKANVDSVASNVATLTTSINTIKANVDSVSSNVSSITSGLNQFTGNITMQRDLTVQGNLVLGGTTTSIQSTDTVIKDRVITLSNGASSPSFDVGIYLTRGTGGDVFVGFDESSKEFVAAYTTGSASNAITDFTITSYANVHFNNLTVDGLVDGVDVATLPGSISTVQTNLNTLTSSVNTIKANVDSVASNVATNTTRINTVQSNVATLTSSVNTIKANVDSVASNVATNTTRINTVQSNVATNTTSINTVQSNVATLTTSVNTIKANVDSVASNVSTVLGSLNNVINGTTPFTGNISVPKVILNSQVQVGANATTSVGTASTTIFTFPGATYRGVDLTIQVQDVTNSQYQISKLLAVHTGAAVDWTEYAILSTNNSDLTSFSASIDGSSVVSILASGGSANKKITVSAQYIIQ